MLCDYYLGCYRYHLCSCVCAQKVIKADIYSFFPRLWNFYIIDLMVYFHFRIVSKYISLFLKNDIFQIIVIYTINLCWVSKRLFGYVYVCYMISHLLHNTINMLSAIWMQQISGMFWKFVLYSQSDSLDNPQTNCRSNL